jgi:hypothetical protein
MIDLNSRSGFVYGSQLPNAASSRHINALIDSALVKHNRRHLARNYLGGSRIGALHHEIVCFDARAAQALFDRATDVIGAAESGELPPRIAANADFYLCRWCGYAKRCWEAAV